jgi:hypothetical protein
MTRLVVDSSGVIELSPFWFLVVVSSGPNR